MRTLLGSTTTLLALLTTAVLATGCSDDDELDSDEAARRAYLGLDLSVEKSMTLGFAGFNAASSANIDPQMTTGAAAGTLTVTGQVDQGNSANKGMRLYIGMVAYNDGDIVINEDGDTIRIVYDTATDPTMQPYLNLSLKNIPGMGSTATGTLEGTLTSNSNMSGVYLLSGEDLQGQLTLNLTIAGTIQRDASNNVIRTPGTTTVTGTATNSDGGVYNINLTL